MNVNVIFEERSFPSADGKNTVRGYVWRPEGVEPRAIIQISHGMCEYAQRYDKWARRFCQHGYIFCGSDHLGHGNTAATAEDLGYTHPTNGADYLVEDIHQMSLLMKAEHPRLPLVLYGHSMGSFVARCYLSRYGTELAAALISGTAGPEAPAAVAKKLVHMIAAVKGDRYRSRFITSLAFGAYNKRFEVENDAQSWLTADRVMRENYARDPFCSFVFTTAGYDTLFTLLARVSRRDWAKTLPKELPVFLFSGDEDPVGNYGKGVKKIYERMKKAGCRNTSLKLYQGGRHEMHHEVACDEVFADILSFLEGALA